MRKTLIRGVALIAVAAALLAITRHNGVWSGREAARRSQERPLAADFSLPDLQGRTLTLSSYRGKVVLLDFWATWCDPCREEITHFVRLQDKYGSQGLQIIGISMDDGPEPVRDFYQKFKMNYPVVMGNAKTAEIYGGVFGLPIAFLIGRDGKIVAKHIGAASAETLERETVSLLDHKGS